MLGVPARGIDVDNDLMPTVPLYFIKNCQKNGNHTLTLPIDIQARLGAVLMTINECQYKVTKHDWSRGFNSVGVRFGDQSFVTLPSFRKRYILFECQEF